VQDAVEADRCVGDGLGDGAGCDSRAGRGGIRPTKLPSQRRHRSPGQLRRVPGEHASSHSRCDRDRGRLGRDRCPPDTRRQTRGHPRRHHKTRRRDESLVVAEATCEELRKSTSPPSSDDATASRLPPVHPSASRCSKRSSRSSNSSSGPGSPSSRRSMCGGGGGPRQTARGRALGGLQRRQSGLHGRGPRLLPERPIFWDRGESDIAADIRTAKEHGLPLSFCATTP
jgi:hypothetical protein